MIFLKTVRKFSKLGFLISLVLLTLFFSPFSVFAGEPAGTGIWIWYSWEENFWGNADILISKLRKAGITWIAVKAGDGDSLWNNPERNAINWLSSNISKFHNAGIKVYGWQYVYGDDEKWRVPDVSEADVASQILDISGIDGLIIDAESEYKAAVDNQGKATRYFESVYQRHPNAFLMYTTFARPDKHSSFPFSVFNRYTKAALPQVYWVDRTPRISPGKELSIMRTQWANISPSVPIYPLASLNTATVEELKEFFIQAQSHNFQNPSFWRYGISIITQDHWDYFEQRSIRKVYEELLGREPDLNGLSWYTNLLNQGWTLEMIRGDIEASMEYKARRIGLLYQGLLARTVDAGGLSWYLDLMANKKWSFGKVEEDIKNSSEYKVVSVNKIYKDFLGREPDSDGFNWYLNLVLNSGWNIKQVEDEIKNSFEAKKYQVWLAYHELLNRSSTGEESQKYVGLMSEGWSIEQVKDDIKKLPEYAMKNTRSPLHQRIRTTHN